MPEKKPAHQGRKQAKEQEPLTKEEFFKALDKVLQPVMKPPPAKGKRRTSE